MTSLILETTKILNNENTPWKDRLKFADNAFVSLTLRIRQKEIFLLKWIFRSPEIVHKSVLQQCLKWLTSSQIIDLNRLDLAAEDLVELANSLSKCLAASNKDCCETQQILHDICAAFIGNKIFQHHFKFNMELYYSFISEYITNIEGETLVNKILSNDQLLTKSLVTDYKLLIEGILGSLVKVVAKYPKSESIFTASSRIITRCIFKPNMVKINAVLNVTFSESNQATSDIIYLLFCANSKITNAELPMYYRLLIESFYKSSKYFPIIYKFIIILFKNLGIRFGSMLNCRPFRSVNCESDKGVASLVQMFEIISRNKNDFDCKVADTSFNDFIKHFVEVRFKQPPCKETLQLTTIILKMNAALILELTDQLIIYLILNNFEDMQAEYNNIFKLLIQTYFKLHRIPGLIHKLLAAPVDGPSTVAVSIIDDNCFRFHNEINCEQNVASTNYNIQSTLSHEILESLSNSLVQLVSNQSINIFMTLLHKFDIAIKELDTTIEEPKKIFILELTSTILCRVLSSVRFADNTISDTIMTKFVNIMEKIKEGLQIFGTSLVRLKHEPHMMRAFLNTSFTWAELYMIFENYSISKNVACKKDTDFNDTSTCNISYLHNYLTSEQWCLISERITNFGETPCKQLLHKLFMQKIKAMYLFESEINKDVFNSVQQTTVSSIRLVWNLLLTDQFAIDVLLPTLEYQDKRILANCLIVDIAKNQEKSSCCEWRNFNDMGFNKAILTNILLEIGKLLRTKRKREDTAHKTSNSTKLMKELLINAEALAEHRIIEIFIECIGKEDTVQNTYNENQMITYLSLLKRMPVASFSKSLQVTIFIYLCALFQDVKIVTTDKNILTELESLILSTLQITHLPIIGKMPITALITFVEQNFNRYSEIFEQVLNIVVKNESHASGLSNGITLLTKSAKTNKKYIDLCLITNETLLKNVNSKKISAEHRALLEGYSNDMFSNLIKLIIDKKVHSVEIYAYALSNSIDKSNTEKLETLLPLLDTYFKRSITDINEASQITGMLILFTTVVKNKTVIKMESTLSIWNACKNITITEKDEEIYTRLIILVFENIANEQFQTLLDDILLSITIAITNDDELAINRELKRCTSIIPSMFNGTKLAIWTKALEQYLFKLTQYSSEKMANNTLVQFVLNLQACAKMNLTPTMFDLCFITVENLLRNVKNTEDFLVAFPAGYSILDSLLKHRKLFILERLPAYLQQYRHLLALLCRYSDVLSKTGSDAHLDQCIEFAHSLERLTTYIVSTGKHMSRISQYLITEFLKHYETITIHASVKLHLNNCVFQLMSLCDGHAVAYLMRGLSTASTEMFKLLFGTYQKYYKFKGKV